MIDYSKAYVTTNDGKEFQILDNDGNTDIEASVNAANAYISSIQIIDDSSDVI